MVFLVVENWVSISCTNDCKSERVSDLYILLDKPIYMYIICNHQQWLQNNETHK